MSFQRRPSPRRRWLIATPMGCRSCLSWGTTYTVPTWSLFSPTRGVAALCSRGACPVKRGGPHPATQPLSDVSCIYPALPRALSSTRQDLLQYLFSTSLAVMLSHTVNGAEIRRLREERGITAAELAQAAGIT